MKKQNFYVFKKSMWHGCVIDTEYCGSAHTLLGAKRIAGANAEYNGFRDEYNLPDIYTADDCEEIDGCIVLKKDVYPIAEFCEWKEILELSHGWMVNPQLPTPVTLKCGARGVWHVYED